MHATEVVSVFSMPSANVSDTGLYRCTVTTPLSTHTLDTVVIVHSKASTHKGSKFDSQRPPHKHP